MRHRIPVIILISGLWLCTPPPESYVVIALLLWLNQKRTRAFRHCRLYRGINQADAFSDI